MYKEEKQQKAEMIITITTASLLDMNKRRFHSRQSRMESTLHNKNHSTASCLWLQEEQRRNTIDHLKHNEASKYLI